MESCLLYSVRNWDQGEWYCKVICHGPRKNLCRYKHVPSEEQSTTKKRGEILKGQCHEKSMQTETLGGKDYRYQGCVSLGFFSLNVPLICHEILKMAPIEVKQNSPVVQEFAIHAPLHIYTSHAQFLCVTWIYSEFSDNIPRALQEYKEKTSNSIYPQKTRKQFGPVNEGPKWDSCGQNCEGWKSCDTDSLISKRQPQIMPTIDCLQFDLMPYYLLLKNGF